MSYLEAKAHLYVSMQNIKLLAKPDYIRYTLRSSAYQMEYKTSHDAHSISMDGAFHLFKRKKIIAFPLPALVVLRKRKVNTSMCTYSIWGGRSRNYDCCVKQ